MARRRAAIVLGTLALVSIAAGCGRTQLSGRARFVQIALTEYRLNPQSVEARRGRLTIYAHNYGRLTHNLVVMRGERTTASTKPISPGRTATLIVYLSPGRYLMTSTILSDRDLGIYGTLTVGH